MTDKFKFTPEDMLSIYSEPEKVHAPETVSKSTKTPEQMEKEAEEIMISAEKKRSRRREEEEIEKYKKTIFDFFAKNPEGTPETSQYFKDMGEKIEKKPETETENKKPETLKKMLDELEQMGVKEYDYIAEKKKNFKKTEFEVKPIKENIENEVLDESKKTDKKVLSIFTKGEPTKEEIKPLPYVPYQGSMKVAVDLPLMESELKNKEKTNVTPDGELKKVLPEIEKVIKSKERKPNPSLQDLASRVKKALSPLNKEEQDGAMTKFLYSLLILVKDGKNTGDPLSDSVFQNYEPEIVYIEEEAKRIKESKKSR